MRPQANAAPSLALKSSFIACCCKSLVVRKLQPSSLKAAPKPSHFCARVVSLTVTVAAAVESTSMPSVLQYAPGAEVTSGGNGTGAGTCTSFPVAPVPCGAPALEPVTPPLAPGAPP